MNSTTTTTDQLFLKVVENISSTNKNDKLNALQTIREIIYIDNDNDDDGDEQLRINLLLLINYGIIPILIEHLKDSSDKEIQYECTWVLDSLSTKNETDEITQCLIENEIHLVIIDLLSIHAEDSYLISRLLSILGTMVIEVGNILIKEGIISILQHISLQNSDDHVRDEVTSGFIFNITSNINDINELQNFLCVYGETTIQIMKSFILKYNGSDYNEVVFYPMRVISNLIVGQQSNQFDLIKELLIKYGITEIIIKITGSIDNDSIQIYGLRLIENMLNLCDNNQDDYYFKLIMESSLINTIMTLINQETLFNVNNLELINDLFNVITKINYGQILLDSGILLKLIQIVLNGNLNFQDGNGNGDGNNMVNEIKFKNINIIFQSLENTSSGSDDSYINQVIYLLENNFIQFLQVNIEIVKMNEQLFSSYLQSIIKMLNKIKHSITNPTTPTTNTITNLYNNTIRNSFIQSIQLHKINIFNHKFDDCFDLILTLLNSINKLI